MPTPSGRFRQADNIFDAALDLDAAERDAFVERACAGDAELHRIVSRLLRAHDGAGDFLSAPALEVAQPILEATAPSAPAAREPLPRAVGPWRVLRELGRGGMGVVYLAVRDDAPGKPPVALKVLRDGATASGTLLRRFLAERRILASLAHPNVARLLDSGIAPGGAPYFSMAYCAGGSLVERLEGGPLPVPDAMRVASELAAALGAAHALGIVHLDVKPANVLFDHDGRAQLSDFGIARLLDHDATQSGQLLGTAAYLAPEQLRGLPVDHRADLWALGVSLYQMLTGTRPFNGASHAAVMHAVLTSEPEPMGRHVAGVPGPLQSLVARLLAKDPEARFQSAAEVAQLLEQGVAMPYPAATFASPSRETPSVTPRPRSRSLLVMPFLAGEGERDGALADGLHEELVVALSRVPGLRVTARSTARALAAKGLDARAIGNMLGVTHLLEGGIRRQGARLHVSLQLVSTSDGAVTWSERWDREFDDIFALQDELARAMVGTLLPALPNAGPPPTRPPTRPAVYELYLKGRHFLHRPTPADLRRAGEFFLEATVQDPAYADAYAGYAEAQSLLMILGGVPTAEGLPSARAALERALALDDASPGAHAASGNVAHCFEWDWQGANTALRRALELDPRHVNALIYVAATQQNLGQVEESIDAGMRVLELDPLSPATNLQIGRAQLAARRPAAALRPLQSALEILPDFILPRVALGEALLMLGRTSDAVAAFRQAAAIAPTLALGDLVRGLAAVGEGREARSVLAQLLALDDSGRLPPLSLACAYAGLGDADAAFSWLDRGFAARTSLMVTVKMWPGLDPIRGDPRFDDLLRRMRLDDASLAGGSAGA